jgi:hypothetical protein
LRRDDHLSEEGTYLVARIRGRKRKRRQARIGAPDAALTPNAGLAAVSELCDRLGVIGALDAAVGPVKQRDRGFGPGELLTGIAAAQLAGEDFLVGLDRQREDAAWPSTRWRWRSSPAKTRSAASLSIIPTGACPIHIDPLHPAPGGYRRGTLGRQ